MLSRMLLQIVCKFGVSYIQPSSSKQGSRNHQELLPHNTARYVQNTLNFCLLMVYLRTLSLHGAEL